MSEPSMADDALAEPPEPEEVVPVIGSIVECFTPDPKCGVEEVAGAEVGKKDYRPKRHLALVLSQNEEQLTLFVLRDVEIDVDSVPSNIYAQHIVSAAKATEADDLIAYRTGWFWTRVVRP